MRRVLIGAGTVALSLLFLLLLLYIYWRANRSAPLAGHELKVMSEQSAVDEQGRRGRILLGSGRFDDLERMADSLEHTDPRWPSGRAMALSFYTATFGSAGATGPDAWSEHLARIREWSDARPQSTMARLAIAEALIGRAWAARGGDWARNVPTSHMERFSNDMAEARAILGQCPEEVKSGREWCGAMLRALHGQGDDEEYRRVAEQAIQRFPAEPRFYTGYAGHLLPRWYGQRGEWEAFAERSTSALPDSIADEFYARILVDEAMYSDTLFAPLGRLPWPRARSGCERWHQRCPTSTEPLSGLAILAWIAGDRATAQRAFSALGDTCDIDLWLVKQNYWLARRWAEGKS